MNQICFATYFSSSHHYTTLSLVLISIYLFSDSEISLYVIILNYFLKRIIAQFKLNTGYPNSNVEYPTIFIGHLHIIFAQPKMIFAFPKFVFGHPKIIRGYLRIIRGYLRIIFTIPKINGGFARTIFTSPRMFFTLQPILIGYPLNLFGNPPREITNAKREKLNPRRIFGHPKLKFGYPKIIRGNSKREKQSPSLSFTRAEYRIIYKNGRFRIQRSFLYCLFQFIRFTKRLILFQFISKPKDRFSTLKRVANDYTNFNLIILSIILILVGIGLAWIYLLSHYSI